MASKPTGKPTGAPPLYKPEYCQMYLDHCREGGTVGTFAASIGRSKQTLYNWAEAYPDFLDAMQAGEGLVEKYYLDMGKALALGQLRRLKSEKPVIVNGKPLYDKDGKVVYEREYEPTTGSAQAWKFIAQNVCRWRENKDIEVSGKGGAPIETSSVLSDDAKEEIKSILKKQLHKKKA